MTPILYSFRRCPYAMRARLALAASDTEVELREILLRDKPAAFLEVSQSATVPCLVTQDGVIDESLDIMIWALRRHDPDGWLTMPEAGFDLIREADGPFKQALDRSKYATRFPQDDPLAARGRASDFMKTLDAQIGEWLFEGPSLADYAILPFVRQFAFIDKAWFDAQDWPALQRWLDRFLDSERFAAIMVKYPTWEAGASGVRFP
ncbi:hypothetical protein ROLI_009620 [Roseobacter fucihabitans]|uniref:GST N-terminal domain-containing protein n=1 Tax=Roseobacter fucihabitans TaxID=1537242 RepID=A0ABZ2BSR8_9RHOB|nr:glutathione S-transferase [Roseobacter litoralis]